MAYRKQITVTGSAGGQSVSTAIVLDRWLGGATIFDALVSGTVDYNIQHTMANPFQVGGIPSGSWENNADTSLVSATTTQNGNYIQAPEAVRVLLNGGSTGTVTFTVKQNGGFPT